MKIKDLRTKTEIDLKNELSIIRKNLFNLRFQSVSSGVQNTSQIGILKKDVARVKTLLTEKNKKIRSL